MMRKDNGSDWIRKSYLFQNLRPNDWMNFHPLEFLWRKLAGLRDDVFRDGEFADVVKKRSCSQRLDFFIGQTKLFCNLHGIDAHALQMFVRGMVLGLNGESERLDRAQVKMRHFFGMNFAVFQLAHIRAVRSINHVERGKGEEGGLPSDLQIEIADETGNGGSDQVVRK